MTDTAKLIAQAREWTHPEHANLPEALHELVYSLADALEAAEAERDECQAETERVDQQLGQAIAELIPMQAENRRLREALDWIEAEPEDPLKVQLWARAALAAGSGG